VLENSVRREIQVGSVTWLNGIPTPLWFAGGCAGLEPAWVPRVYMLLKATSNPAPGSEIADFGRFREGKQYRALTYCRCSLDIDSATGELGEFDVLEVVHDPGWTPPFRYTECPPSLMPALFAHQELRDPTWYPGEASALSQICVEEQHPNSTIEEVPDTERVLVNSLIKCRAGSHADEVGIRLGSPFHAPWVWNEWLLTYAPGQLKLYLRGSRFPSHTWYVDGRQVVAAAGIGDASFPEEPPAPAEGVIQRGMLYSVPQPRSGKWIHLPRLALYPAVLSQGTAATNPQTPNGAAEQGWHGPVAKHPNTVPGWRVATVIKL
jgi:hypothetical protein